MPVIMTSIIVEVFPWHRYPSRLKTDRYRAAMDISVIFFDTEHRNSLCNPETIFVSLVGHRNLEWENVEKKTEVENARKVL